MPIYVIKNVQICFSNKMEAFQFTNYLKLWSALKLGS